MNEEEYRRAYRIGWWAGAAQAGIVAGVTFTLLVVPVAYFVAWLLGL